MSDESKTKSKVSKKQICKNGATLYRIAYNGANAVNVFELGDKLSITTSTGKGKDFETLSFRIKNGKLNIFWKENRPGNGKTIRNITRKPNVIQRRIKNALARARNHTWKNHYTPPKFELDGDLPF